MVGWLIYQYICLFVIWKHTKDYINHIFFENMTESCYCTLCINFVACNDYLLPFIYCITLSYQHLYLLILIISSQNRQIIYYSLEIIEQNNT